MSMKRLSSGSHLLALIALALILAPITMTSAQGTSVASGVRASSTPLRTGAQFIADIQARLVRQTTSGNTLSYYYSLTFPTKVTGKLSITLSVDQSYALTKDDKAGAGVYGLRYTRDLTMHLSTLKYFVPYRSLPPSVVKQLRTLTATPAHTDAADMSLAALTTRQVAYDSQFLVADEAGGEGASNESGNDGVGVTIVGQWVDSGLHYVEGFMEALGLEVPELLEDTATALTAGLGLFEALSLNNTDTTLVQQLDAYRDCADDLAAQEPNLKGAAGRADASAGKAGDWVGSQFMLQMAQSLPGVETVAGLFNVNFVKLSESDLEASLQELRQNLPQCRGRWFGSYHIEDKTQVFGGVMSVEDVGQVRFSVDGDLISGSVSGVQAQKTVGTALNMSGGSSYTGSLIGTASYADPKITIAELKWVKLVPDHYTVTGAYVNSPTFDVRAVTKTWALVVGLSEVVPNSTDFPPNPAGIVGHYKVVLHQLK